MPANPFAAFGDYRQAAANPNNDDLVTLSYLTGLPDPNSLRDSRYAIIFKNLVRRDPTTKDRALDELTAAFEEVDFVDESIHLAWVQVYAKLSYDTNASIRAKAHKILGLLYAKVGRKTTKFLKYSLGPWLAGTHDPDPLVAHAASAAFNAVFPGERKQAAIRLLEDALVVFVVRVVTVENPGSMSDMRYISEQDALRKYNRALKTAVDILRLDLAHLNPTTSTRIRMLSAGPLWRYFPSGNSPLTRSLIALATAWLDYIGEFKPTLWKQVLKALRVGPLPVSLDMVQLLTIITRKYPDLWDENGIAALAQFIGLGPQRLPVFFPLLFNLIMLLPDEVSVVTNETSAKLLLKTLAALVPTTVGETEHIAWGCFLSLSTKPAAREKFTASAIELVAIRAARPMSPKLIEAIGKRFEDYALIGGTQAIVSKHLHNLNFAKVVASSRVFVPELQAEINNMPTEAIAEIVELQPNLKIRLADCDIVPELLDTALKSQDADLQGVVELLLPKFPTLLLGRAQELADKGIKADASWLIDESNPTFLAAAVGARGVFVTDEQAGQYLIKLVEIIMDENDGAVVELARALAASPAFCHQILTGYSDYQKLLAHLYEMDSPAVARVLDSLNANDNAEILIAGVEKAITQANPEMDMLVSRARSLLPRLSTAELSQLVYAEFDWNLSNALGVPTTAQWVYPISCYPLMTDSSADGWNSVLSRAVFVLHVVNDSSTLQKLPVEHQTAVVGTLALIASAARGMAYAAENRELAQAFADDFDASFGTSVVTLVPQLWDLTAGSDAVSFHAAQVLAKLLTKDQLSEKVAEARAAFRKPSIRGALLAQSGAAKNTPWYDREQAMLLKELQSAASFTMVDANTDPEQLQEVVCSKAATLDHDAIVQALAMLGKTGGSVDLVLAHKALEGGLNSQFALLKLVKDNEFPLQVAVAASHLRTESTQFEHELARMYLEHAKLALDQEPITGISEVYALGLSGTETLPWIAFCYLRTTVIERYKSQLAAGIDAAQLPGELQELLKRHNPVTGWLLYLACVQTYAAAAELQSFATVPVQTIFNSARLNGAILAYIGSALGNADAGELANVKSEELVVGSQSDEVNAVHLLFSMGTLLGGTVRKWYRDFRDRRRLKNITSVLAGIVLPGMMRSISKEAAELRESGKLPWTSVSEQAREFRALIKLEESSVEVVITLPAVYPTKPVHVDIKNLGGVPESKKRSWILETEQKAQTGAVVAAMGLLVTKITTFLDGVEPCAICYQMMLNGRTLPSRTCSTCNNGFHSECLSQWFNSNGTKLCPMCRSNF